MKYSVSKIRGDIGGECLNGQLKFSSQLFKVFSFEDMFQHIRDTSGARHDKDQMSKTF
jgi:hypothetical protein